MSFSHTPIGTPAGDAELHPVLRQWATYRPSERTRWVHTAPTELLAEALTSWERVVEQSDEAPPAEISEVVEHVRRVLDLREQLTRNRICPVCGFGGLDRAPYLAYEGPEMVLGASPPYSVRLGDPSHDRCPCCGYEFGYDDDSRARSPVSFEDWRSAWLAAGAPWTEPGRRPPEWDALRQLEQLAVPDQLHLLG